MEKEDSLKQVNEDLKTELKERGSLTLRQRRKLYRKYMKRIKKLTIK